MITSYDIARSWLGWYAVKHVFKKKFFTDFHTDGLNASPHGKDEGYTEFIAIGHFPTKLDHLQEHPKVRMYSTYVCGQPFFEKSSFN